MFDPFRTQGSSSSVPIVRDYRNAKFQLQSSSDSQESIGLLLDHNYLFALARWKGTKVQGPAFILFPDDSYFQGDLEQGLPKGLCTFGLPSGTHIHFRFEGNTKISVIQEDSNGKSLQPVIIKSSVLAQMFEGEPLDHSCLTIDYSQNPSNYIKKSQTNYQDQTQLAQKIKGILEFSKIQQICSYEKFIKQNLISEHQEKNKLEVNSNSSELMIRFPSSSIVCKIQHQPMTSKLLGFENGISSQMEYSRKNIGNGLICQQVGKESLNYTVGQRPSECLNALHLHYRLSLQFVNQYFPTDCLYRLRLLQGSLNNLFNHLFMDKQAHMTLQCFAATTGKQKNRLENSTIQQRSSLADVRKDILRAVRTKSFSRSPIRSASKSRYDYIYPTILNQSFQMTHVHNRSSQKRQLAKSTVIPTKVKSGVTPQKVKAEQLYMGMTNKSKRNKQSNPGTPLPKKSTLSKYAYLSESRNYNIKKMQNIEALTRCYQQVEKDLRKDKEATPVKLLGSYQKPERLTPSTTAVKRRLQYGWD